VRGKKAKISPFFGNSQGRFPACRELCHRVGIEELNVTSFARPLHARVSSSAAYAVTCHVPSASLISPLLFDYARQPPCQRGFPAVIHAT
jgi:hypothetical protein